MLKQKKITLFDKKNLLHTSSNIHLNCVNLELPQSHLNFLEQKKKQITDCAIQIGLKITTRGHG